GGVGSLRVLWKVCISTGSTEKCGEGDYNAESVFPVSFAPTCTRHFLLDEFEPDSSFSPCSSLFSLWVHSWWLPVAGKFFANQRACDLRFETQT
ncbi:hypothetical protein H0E87_031595, partial [Populus deltoides]